MQGRIIVSERQDLRIHTYTAPEFGWSVNSHVIELANSLLVIDAQYTLPLAHEVVEYASTLKKSISRLYITHYHPDHLLGAAAFAAPIYGLEAVAKKIEQVGDRVAGEEREKLGPVIPELAERIQVLVNEGDDIIDGTRIRFIQLRGAETASALVVALPEHDVLITQDLLYHRVHAFVGEHAFDSWRKALTEFASLGYGTILPGHGKPGGTELWEGMARYLTAAEETWKASDNAETFRDRMIETFPDFEGSVLLAHQGRFLYPASRQS